MSGDNCLICHTDKKTRIRLNCCQTGSWTCYDCFKSAPSMESVHGHGLTYTGRGVGNCPRCHQSVKLVSKKVKNVCSRPCAESLVFLGIGLYLTQLILTGTYGASVNNMCNDSKHCYFSQDVIGGLMATYIIFAISFGLFEFACSIMMLLGLEHGIDEIKYTYHSNFYWSGYYYIPSLLWKMKGLEFPRNFVGGFCISTTIYVFIRMILYVALCSYCTNQGANDKYFIMMIIAYYGGHVIQYIFLPVLCGLICLICSGSSVFEAELQLLFSCNGSSVPATVMNAGETGQGALPMCPHPSMEYVNDGGGDETGHKAGDETDQKADEDKTTKADPSVTAIEMIEQDGSRQNQ